MKHCGNVPVFVTDYPEELKPFYAQLNEDHKTVSHECIQCTKNKIKTFEEFILICRVNVIS